MTARVGAMWSMADAEVIARDLVGSMEPRWSHQRAAGRVPEELAATKAIGESVVAAAWMHDIG